MGFKKSTQTTMTRNGKTLKGIIDAYEKLQKADGTYNCTDIAFGKSNEYGDFCVLIDDFSNTFMYAPTIEIEGLKEAYESGDMPASFTYDIVTKKSEKTKRDYFIMEY